jgi:hypothetical protein
MSRRLVAGGLILAILIALAALGIAFRPDRAIRVATGFVAHTICSKTFVSGLDPQTVFTETLDRQGIRRLRWGLNYRLDRANEIVDASFAGMLGSRAAFHDGFGCVTLAGSAKPYLLRSDIAALKIPKTPPLLAEIAGAAVVEPSDARLKAALDHAFEEPAEPPFRRTKAVVVVQDGKVIAERYADGIGVDTPLLGFSMTKSVINALIGLLTQQGLVTPSMTAPIAEWRGADDPRREIEIEHLMRMTTGLALDETNSGFDLSSQMLYLYHDMAGPAVKAALIATPGTRWAYSSPSTQILARIIRNAVGGPEQTLRFAWRDLFKSARHAQRHAGIRRQRHAAGLVCHARKRAGLGPIRTALSAGRRGRGQTHPAPRLGRSFSQRDARYRLRRGLLDQPQRARARQGPHCNGHPPRRVFRIRRSRPARRHIAVAADGDRPPRRLRGSDRRHPRTRAAGARGDRGDAMTES